MGEMTRILITGANGFVGRAAVAEARKQGFEVIAVYRRQPLPEWAVDNGVIQQQADLSDPACAALLHEHMDRVGAVIHAAAHMGGDAAQHAEDTLCGTQTVLEAMRGSNAQLVLVSSVAVYDTLKLEPGDTLTEDSPLEELNHARDPYAEAKLQQEHLCVKTGHPVWLMRPGAVYGPGRTWHALMGFWAWKLHVQINSDGQLPLVHVEHLAQTLVSAAQATPKGTHALNVVDDDLPTRARFLAAHRKMTGWPRMVLPLPFGPWLALTRILKPISGKLPGLLKEPVVRARLMPLNYPNTALRAALGGADFACFENMLSKSLGGQI
ncbi:NAD-dependent epimerase/dehydratase family protein [Pelagimonas varians]|uniref:UDP-glucose 4-epimerase n=1 Tax=Pelagimonas varians TaxID=696760 RepID=A0A238KLF3_9RHOB|nr:NAD-dependent epimerase/dehydratase family protein [Pelagimonas varians]PYG29518.1 UDP-glucose 4-epimerase [Pelagimonas varians]SMX42902.1 UDP-glucose 4-epimerase [Pelagimonas varians]